MKKLVGQIINASGDKTKVVKISTLKRHPIYLKSFQVTKKILAHDEKNIFNTNDIVEIVPSKPLSRQKAWVITRKIK